ncbi:MAG: hypothetical protein HKN88_03410 [Gammaproteobacteria bacterium]|nr:SOS response-associated peptidase [Gammaproteobacteria bacterium]NNC97101.1 hypothetical protein [Gammaproteobacteria bacterium]NNM14113.1 hypothetical protein [Gammaproteobacteria bacterium]
MSLELRIDDYASIQSALELLGVGFPEAYFTSRSIVQPPEPLWAVYSTFGKVKIAPAEWGMLPNWDKKQRITRPLTIARTETIHERVSFKSLIRRYRAIIAVNGFTIRTTKHGMTHGTTLQHRNNEAFLLGALYQFNVDGNMQVALLTKSQRLTNIKKTIRLPLFIEQKQCRTWLKCVKINTIDSLMQDCDTHQLRFLQQ